ncbi:ALF repeat-containing protein [Pseudosporangium ferrugineum]
MASTETLTADNKACQTVERKVYKDIREMLAIDLDAATDTELQILAAQLLTVAKAASLPILPGEIEEVLRDPEGDLRAFLKTGAKQAWTTDLRISVVRTLTNAGTNLKAAAQKALDTATIDAYLAYLNDGQYVARELDCAAQPTPSVTPTATATATPAPTATATATPAPTASASTPGTAGGGGEGTSTDKDEDGGLPVTGADTALVASIGGTLLLLGTTGYLIGRRRRSRFVA